MRRAGRGVPRSIRTLALVAGVAGAGFLPLYGDPRLSPVSHSEWARMIVRSLDLLESGLTDQASQVFSTLSGKDSRAYRADRYAKGEGVEVVGEGAAKAVRAKAPVAEVTYPLAIARGGDYRLRLRLAGSSEAEAEVTEAGKEKPLRVFRVAPTGTPAWIEAGMTHLDPGLYTAAVLLPTGSVLEWLELAPPCINPIEPRGGWQPAAVTSTQDVAVTVLQAVDQESELPPASPPLEWQGTDFTLDQGELAVPASSERGALRSGPKGSHAVLVATLPEPGLYTLSVFGDFPGGQSWLLDGCRKSVLCPSPEATTRWRVVLSGVFAAGPHSFSVTLGPDTVIQRLRLERKKDGVEDYTATLKRLGLDLGPAGPVTRAKADEARRFIERRRSLQGLEACGDIVRPSTLVAATPPGGPGSSQGPGAGPGPGPGPGPGQDPISPPVIPPQEPASPVLPVGFR